MRAEVIGIGTEILLGQIANSNAQWISQRLAEVGVDVLHHQAVGDNEERIAEAFQLALSRADVVVATGGLGPTQDDITREGLARALGVRLVYHPEIEAFLREKYRRLGREMPESNLRQCLVPEGARYILPQRGTAPGLVCEAPGGRRVYAVPGVPAEMQEMMTGTILPELAARSGSTIVSRVIRVTGIPEARVGEVLADLFESSTNPTLAYLASSGEVKVRLTAKAGSREEAEALIEPVAREVAARLGDHVFTTSNEELEEVVGRLLLARRRTVACGESLTGGSLGVRITNVPGASAYFRGSAVCYTAEAKRAVLGVSEETLARFGPVSEQTAREMAEGARRLFGAGVGVGVTGVAGPEPHGGRAPGTVCAAVVGEGEARSRSFVAPGDRAQVRRWAEQLALDLLRRHLAGLPDSAPGAAPPAPVAAP
ncbi:MAG TPA: competence/damage-inducible protein A [Actinomycetota bacterium]|nr:competence/damage-inducible protein A [Actinomycetota bacterium]